EGLRVKLVQDSQDGIVKQCFFEHSDRKWKHLDFSGSDAGEFEQWKILEAQRNFNLFGDILHDFCLIQFPDGTQGFSMRTHHICSDSLTCISLAKRVSELYKDMVFDKPQTTHAIEPYRDFVAYEQEYLASPDFVRDREFWMSENLHQLPEYSLAPKRTHDNAKKYDALRYEIPEKLLKPMMQLHRDSGLSLFVQFFSALALVVHRITSLDSFAISFFGHNRTREDMKTTAGMFVGTYPLRIDITEKLSFLDLAKRISYKFKKIVKVHGMFPFDELVKLTRDEHHADINHLINLSVIDLFYSETEDYLVERVHQKESQNHLSLYIERYENPKQPSTIRFTFDTSVYRKSDIQNLFTGIRSILQNAFPDTSAKISELPLIPPDQYQKLIHEFNNSTRPFPKDKCVHHLFEETALKNLSNTAIECEGRTITYGELNRQADMLAEKLRYAGVGPEKIVGIYMNKSIETVITFLAVLKAGGVYVPIDPTLPAERIRFILQDTNPVCLIVHQRFAERAGKDYRGKCVVCAENRFITGDWEETKTHLTIEASPGNLMYVIYTSGSTGRPKGVMVEHHSFVNLISDQVQRYRLTEKDRFLHFISFSFDASHDHLYR
ncbi:MAG: AMP-binding protein, partial [Holophagae bacterium]|nr:AMP-binding protein [Holophagae bacterium]